MSIETAKNGKSYIEIAASKAGCVSSYGEGYDYRDGATLNVNGSMYTITGSGKEYKSNGKMVCRLYLEAVA